jgi:hypothetical protein
MQKHYSSLALLVAASLGCSATDVDPNDFALPPGAPRPIETDAANYLLAKVPGGYAAEAEAVYTNTTGHPVYYQRCLGESDGPIYSIRRTGRDSTAPAVVSPVWSCVGGVPTGQVRPADELRVPVLLGSTDSPEAQPPISPEERVGQFRVEFALCSNYAADSENCTALPQPARESNAFDVRLSPP